MVFFGWPRYSLADLSRFYFLWYFISIKIFHPHIYHNLHQLIIMFSPPANTVLLRDFLQTPSNSTTSRNCEFSVCFKTLTAMCITRLTLLGLLQNTDRNVHHETDFIRATAKHWVRVKGEGLHYIFLAQWELGLGTGIEPRRPSPTGKRQFWECCQSAV
jgi:hypothetical protein